MSRMKDQITQAERADMISDHVPYKYDDTMIWNIDVHVDNIPEVAHTIAKKIADGDVSTVMLQEVNITKKTELIRLINQDLAASGTGIQINDSMIRFGQKKKHGFGNLIISTKSFIRNSTLLNKIRGKINQASHNMEAGQIQVDIVPPKNPHSKPRILLNVHLNLDWDPNGRLKVKDLYESIQALANTPPYNHYEIIIAGDFNKGSRLPEELLGKSPVQDADPDMIRLKTNFGYKHPQNTSYVLNSTTMKHELRGVDAVLAFNRQQQTDLVSLVDDNFGASLPPNHPMRVKNFPTAQPAVQPAGAQPAAQSVAAQPGWRRTPQPQVPTQTTATPNVAGNITQDTHKLNMSHMISKHAPYQFGNIMVWNIDPDKNKVNAVAETIAAKIVAGEIDTFMLQGVDADAYMGAGSYSRSFLALINDHIVRLSTAQNKPPVRLFYTTPSLIGKHRYGNLTISTRPIATTVNDNNDQDKNDAITKLKAIIKKAGGENGQVQLAIVKGKRGKKDQILLNVHASSDEKARIDLNKIYEFIDNNKDEPPFDDFEIIMTGDFNADFNALPREVLGYKRKEPKYPYLKVRELEDTCYQHGTYTSYQQDGKPKATDAVFAFNRDEDERTLFCSLLNDNLGASLDQNDDLYQANQHRFSTSEEEDTDSEPEPTLVSDEDLQNAMSKVFHYCENKGYQFNTDDATNISSIDVPLSSGTSKIYVNPQKENGVTLSTKLTDNAEDNKVLLGEMAKTAEAAGVRQVRLVLKNADGLTPAEKKTLMDQLWLAAKNNNLDVIGYEPEESVKQQVQPTRAPAASQDDDTQEVPLRQSR